jgi:hypothetical protein
MKSITRQGAQGDVLFIKVSKVPEGFVEAPRKEEEPVVVAHSETGHNHVIMADVAHFIHASDNMKSYVKLGTKPAHVEHLRAWDTHETLELKGEPGEIWEIRRQEEWTPEGWKRAVLD